MASCKQCCGTCEYGSYDKMNGYVCVNDQSEYVADFVEYDHSCIDWEQKRRKHK
nr:MAG TPA: zona-pellucida-binding protein-like protein [Bacteriophage sp.]